MSYPTFGRGGCGARRRCAGWSPRPGSHPAELVLPMFVKEGLTEPRPIASLPGRRAAHPRVAAQGGRRGGAGGRRRDDALRRPGRRGTTTGSGGTDPDGILNVAIRDVMAEVGDATVVMSDLCLDEFTSHGHCGVLAADGSVDNDATLARYAEMAVVQAAAGVDMVGPSGMMDGQVGVVRRALDGAGHHGRRHPRLRRQVRLRVLRPVPRGGRVHAGRRPADLPAGPGERCARRCARSRSTSPRAPTS